MQLRTFLSHWQIQENPFNAEEARDDPVFARLVEIGTAHPDFEKVLGEPARPRPAVVFGEKGSGKTALRLMLERYIERHNGESSDGRVWVVRYDDINPVLDRLAQHRRFRKVDGALHHLRLADHMDAILARAATRLVDLILDNKPGERAPIRIARRLAHQQRIELATLALLYDQPAAGDRAGRWERVRRLLRINAFAGGVFLPWLGVLMLLAAAGIYAGMKITDIKDMSMTVVSGALAGAGLLALGVSAWRWFSTWRLGRTLRSEMRALVHQPEQFRLALSQMPQAELRGQLLPSRNDLDARYKLIQRFIDLIGAFGYDSMLVLVDRVDEPDLIAGDPDKMRSLIWPMLDNKFLQQDRVGVKLLLPMELRHLLGREEAEFFQRARLDKQHMVDRLSWSGTLLYDLCSQRVNACRPAGLPPLVLADLFEEDVDRQQLIDALDQMRQPRDAFKFLYRLLQEHCASVTEEKPIWRIPRLTLEQVRRDEARRLQEFERGFGPG